LLPPPLSLLAKKLRRKAPAGSPAFVPYAGPFIAMLMGDALLAEMNIKVDALDHRNFEAARKLVEASGDRYAQKAIGRLARGLKELYGDADVSLQRLSATFRRGDLLEYLWRAEILDFLPDLTNSPD